jgi:hypothetical protein
MMTDQQRFVFDVQGYLVVEGVLAPDRVERMREHMGTSKNAILARVSSWSCEVS